MPDEVLAAVGLRRSENGYCAEFDAATNQCRIYETRPAVCRITEPSRYRFTAGICNAWMREAGLTNFITDQMLQEAGA